MGRIDFWQGGNENLFRETYLGGYLQVGVVGGRREFLAGGRGLPSSRENPVMCGNLSKFKGYLHYKK